MLPPKTADGANVSGKDVPAYSARAVCVCVCGGGGEGPDVWGRWQVDSSLFCFDARCGLFSVGIQWAISYFSQANINNFHPETWNSFFSKVLIQYPVFWNGKWEHSVLCFFSKNKRTHLLKQWPMWPVFMSQISGSLLKIAWFSKIKL